MLEVLITGAGKIGSLIAVLLAESKSYKVHIADVTQNADLRRLQEHISGGIEVHTFDVSNHNHWETFMNAHPIQAVISSLPYFLNPIVAKMALKYHLHYFDLTEDTSVTAAVKDIARNAKTAFVPQCGLAPGFISIAANSMMKEFDELDIVKLRVGALPQNTSNALFYALTWSTDGVINEYGNPCYAIENREAVVLKPLEGLEQIVIDGIKYEAFNTSGGLGSLTELAHGRVNALNYKTVRYPGHCEKMRVLMNDLKLNEDRPTLKRILENAIPKTYQDVVVVYVSVSGMVKGTYMEESYAKRIYPRECAGLLWSAIQISTAAGICAVVDLVLAHAGSYSGFVYQEQFALKDFLANRFGSYYQ